MRNKVKRTLSFLLTFVMLCSLLPMTAMAKELQPGEVAASKTASYDAQKNEVTITMRVEGKEASQITPSKADVVLVVDNSGSMASSVGEPCETPKAQFENVDLLGLVKQCPECGARYWNGPLFGYVPDICEGETGSEPRIDTAQKVGKAFADSILSGENENQMAVIGFAHGERGWFGSTDAIRKELDLTDSVTDVKNTLDAMVADGGTDYTSALQEAYNMLNDRGETDRPGYVVFISDGAPGKQGSSIGDPNWNGSRQARAIKEAGYGLYTIGIALDDEADDYLESLASDNHYQNVTGTNYASELEELLKEWAEEINTVPAGTDAVLVDTISDQFTLKEDQNVTGLTFDYANNRVTWNVGEITEEGKAVSFVVIPKDGVYGDNIPTNTEAELTYTDAKGKFQTLNVANATVNIPAPVAETVTLTYDANGGEGAPANEQVEKGKTATLNNTIKPTHVPKDGRDVEFKGWSADEAVINQVYEKDNVPATVTTIDIAEENVTVYAVWVYGDPVDPVDPPEPPTWDHSKDKTATELDNNFNSRVTLSLPSAEKELVSDVVFVLDKSTSATVENQALGMLKQLKEKAAEDGATVKVGVVIFNKEAHVTEWKDLVTEYDAIKDAITQEISSGTNTHAGLLAAQKMLEDDKNVEDSRKHMIFVSDGITYIFEEPAQAINSQQLTNGEYGIMAGNDCWGIRHYYEGGDNFIPDNWDAYLQDVENHLSDVEQYIQPYDNMSQENHIPRGNTVLPTTVDVALYKTAKLYHELSEKYHCYAVLGDTGVTNYPWGPHFMTYLADGKKVSFDDIQKDIYYLLDAGSQVVDIIGQGKDNQGKDYNFNVVNLENMTITVGGVELKKEKISDNEYGFGDVRDGIYDFKVTYYPEDVADADGEKREHFVWDINVPVSNFAPAQFSYDVHLTNPQTAKGEYKVETNVEAVLTPRDSNGTEGSTETFPVPELTYEVKGGGSGEDYRYVNVTVVGKGDVDYKCGDHKGTITEKDGTELLTLDLFENSMKFNMEPASGWKLDRIEVNGKDVGKDLEYKMIFDEVTGDQMDIDVKIVFKEKSDGGSGGGSHRPSNKPDKTPEALNGDDHFDYVVGYSDGLVHPERNITRAEVASIFFRLLQDDVREKNLTDQNPFNDVFTDDWFNVAVSTMYDMDIVYGRDNNNFDPNAYITRAEFAAIAARFDSEGYSGENLFTDIDGHWAANQINRAAEKGWISGYPDGTFGPDRYITRAEAVTMINRVLNRLPESADALHEDMNVFPDNMDTTAWYYLAIQEATSSHEYEKDKDGVYETWTDVLPDRDWAQYLKLN
ncbi:S-layer homology domain-containing protein [Anaerotignum lactatifermentans]|uniref:S-layer homology domain-containing protein n=1 Tax=Anaerotignum lactatifermentans TaxID=160404 RepID=UPI00262D46C9|nr:S-layer homology domain-containing protein [Anaerotignum lactatifermentans]